MRRSLKIAAVTLGMAALSAGAAFAAGWQKNDKGWWYGTNADNSAWHANGWQWVDGNGDGVAECYYFDANGYCLMNTTTPDGYKVDGNGAWLVNGAVQTKTVGNSASETSNASSQTSNMSDGTYCVAFKQSDIQKNGGQYKVTVTVYQLNTYSKEYVMSLKRGDTMTNFGTQTQVESVEYTAGYISINDDVWFLPMTGSSSLYIKATDDGYTEKV